MATSSAPTHCSTALRPVHPRTRRSPSQIALALDATLKEGELGTFELPALNGVLVGETLPDPDCPDAKARPRAPTILRVVFFPGAPPAAEWIQSAGPLQNPYFGAEMLECGTEVKPQ